MSAHPQDHEALGALRAAAAAQQLAVAGGRIRRTSSRFCLGVEHGDYNGTELFGVGTDRFIWMALQPNESGLLRLFSANFPDDGVVSFRPGGEPSPRDTSTAASWARFAFGVVHILRREGYPVARGFDAVLQGNIPGGGMSRSASLAINLILSVLEANGVEEKDGMRVVELAQMVENDYIGSPCGLLDQIMIYFAKEGMGTHYDPTTRSISYVPLGSEGRDLRIVSLDTGTVRPGLEKSTYKVRRAECEELLALLQRDGHALKALADIRDQKTYDALVHRYGKTHPLLMRRLAYLYPAQQRFYRMMDAWEAGDVVAVGRIFREDGHGLRDDYAISGPELEAMCDIARTVPGVLGERMLGGGDKGAAGALVRADAVEALKAAVDRAYPLSHPEQAGRYAVHACRMVQGVTVLLEPL